MSIGEDLTYIAGQKKCLGRQGLYDPSRSAILEQQTRRYLVMTWTLVRRMCQDAKQAPRSKIRELPPRKLSSGAASLQIAKAFPRPCSLF